MSPFQPHDHPLDGPLTPREEAVIDVVLERVRRVLTRVILAIAAAVLIGGGGTTLGWLLTQQESRERDRAIQDSRRTVFVQGCLETNERSRRTMERLESLFPEKPTLRQQRSIQSTKLLIRALAPYRGDIRLRGKARYQSELEACVRYAEQRLGD